MGKLHACLFVALVACGSDNEKKPDAQIILPDAPIDSKVFNDAPIDAPPMFDFSCYGNTAPTTAADPVSISGTATEIDYGSGGPTFTMLSGATVKACKGNCTGQNNLGMATSDTQGAWSITGIATGGTPLTAYVTVSKTGDRTTNEYPATPVVANLANVPVFTLTPALVNLLGLGGICTQNDTANGMMVLAFTDCANMPISDTANLTISIKQGGNAITGDTVVDLGNVQAMLKGTYLVCNVPADPATNVGATYMSTSMTYTLLAHDVGVTAGTTTATQVRPGY